MTSTTDTYSAASLASKTDDGELNHSSLSHRFANGKT